VSLLIAPQLPRPDYSPTEASIVHPSGVLVLLGVLLVCGALGTVIAHARRPTPWTLAAVYASATFAPVSNLLVRSGVVLAERTLYSPSVGVALVYGAVLAAAWKTRPRLAALTATLLALLSIAYTVQAIPIWHDTLTVFEAMRIRGPDSYRGFALSAAVREGAGDHATAHQYFVQSLALYSRDPNVLNQAGSNALVVGDTADALTWLDAALRLDPDRATADDTGRVARPTRRYRARRCAVARRPSPRAGPADVADDARWTRRPGAGTRCDANIGRSIHNRGDGEVVSAAVRQGATRCDAIVAVTSRRRDRRTRVSYMAHQ
jgi:tetratricopeptide (TPR) repeat protein